jgi:hypothetical protein
LQKIYRDTEIQVLYRRGDDFSKSGNFGEAMGCLEEMKAKFQDLNEKHKDKHIRQKLTKCNYMLQKILNSPRDDLNARASEMCSWIESREYQLATYCFRKNFPLCSKFSKA